MIQTLPLSTQNTINSEKLSIKFFPLFSIDGFLVQKIIGINSRINLYQKRFTICHEIGHYLNGDTQDLIGIAHWKSESEKKADKYAFETLLPKSELLEEFEYYEGDLKMLEKVFGVEMEVIHKRLINLGFKNE